MPRLFFQVSVKEEVLDVSPAQSRSSGQQIYSLHS